MVAILNLCIDNPWAQLAPLSPYLTLISSLNTIFVPILVLLTESEQFKYISALLSDISAVNLMVGWNLLACSIN